MMDDSKYIPFHLASQALASRLGATPEEVSLWAWFGKHHGGLNPFRSSRPAPYGDAQMPLPLNPPTHDQVSAGEGSSLWLAGAYFRKADIEGFDPAAAGRFISWPDLVARWEARGLSAAEVLMKVRSLVASDQIDEPVAPIFGASDGLAPQDWAMFRREQIEAIEDHEFPTDGDASATSGAAIAGNLTDLRIAAILEIAHQLKLNPQCVPYGGKAEIRHECLDKRAGEPLRFTADTFKKAWQTARNKMLIKGENDEIYRGQ